VASVIALDTTTAREKGGDIMESRNRDIHYRKRRKVKEARKYNGN